MTDDRHLRRRYGITGADYDRMLADQDGGCAICGRPPAAKRLCVDHCHACGEVRGLLCMWCNYVLGKWKDDADRFSNAGEYLRRHEDGDMHQT